MPRRRQVLIKLRAYGDTPTTDQDGNPTTPFIETEVFARKASIGSKSHYSSLSYDKELDIKFIVRLGEYSDQEEIEVVSNGKVYEVDRTFELGIDWIELFCIQKRYNA